MKKIIMLAGLVLMITTLAFATGEGSKLATTAVKGVVVDHLSGEVLAGAEIAIPGTNIKVYSNLDGEFEISNLTPGNYNMVVSYISYNQSLIENMTLTGTQINKLEIKLVSAE